MILELHDPPGASLSLPPGLIAATRAESERARDRGVGRVQVDGRVHALWHRACSPTPTAAREFIEESDAAGVSLHLGGDARPAVMAVKFSVFLDEHRRRIDLPTGPCITSHTKPRIARGGPWIRLPHLTTVRLPGGAIDDAVIWEMMTRERASRWLDGDLPDQSFFEEHLDDLLLLRGRIRRGSRKATGAPRWILEGLGGRDLSILFVYRNAFLFEEILRKP